MPDTMSPGPAFDLSAVQEAACVHTRKIFDSCQSKDCMEDLRFYPTVSGAAVIDQAVTVKSGQAQLLYVLVNVEPIGLNQGYYTIDLRFYYKMTCDAYTGAVRPTPVTGLLVFDKRCVLFGSAGGSQEFSSETSYADLEAGTLPAESALPVAVVEAVDPIVLALRLVNTADIPSADDPGLTEIPEAIASAFDEEISFSCATVRRIYATLGQFSILRLERDTQLLMPIYDYCMPEKQCDCDTSENDPCDIFQQVDFPVGQFFPPDSAADLDAAAALRRSLV